MSSPSQPRILQLMLSTQEGGAENFFEKLAMGFDARGIEQCLVIERQPKRAEHLSQATCAEVVQIPFRGLNRPFAPGQLRNTIGPFRPDVILTWMNRASRRIPAGLTCPVVGRLGGYYDLRHYANCSHLIGITPDLVAHITSSGWPETATTLIPNFGETPSRATDGAEIRQRIGVPTDVPLLLALGRLHPVKAHDVLLRALAEVPRAVLMIAGEGPLKEELMELATSLGIQDRVHFLGWRRDVGALFAAADICVFPSRYEPNGTVVMESWAHRVPLVAARAKGPEWLVTDEVDGLLFPIDDVLALTERLRRVISEPGLAALLVHNGLATFEGGFTQQAVVDSYLSLFDNLTSESTPDDQ